MKKIFLCLGILLLSNTNAKIINQIAALVDDRPITTYEIDQLSTNLRIPKKEAFNMLINQKLFLSQMDKMNLLVSDEEVNDAIEQIMKKNNLTKEKLELALKHDGKTMQGFKEEIKKQIEQEKLLAPQLAKLKAKITPQNVRKFYDTHPDLFSVFTSVTLTRYHAPSRALLEEVKKNPNRYINGVIVQRGTLSGKQITNSLMYIVSKTPKNGFSPILQSSAGFDMFYINSVSGKRLIDYKIAQKAALGAFIQAQKEQIMKNYAQSLRSDAVIEILDPAYK